MAIKLIMEPSDGSFFAIKGNVSLADVRESTCLRYRLCAESSSKESTIIFMHFHFEELQSRDSGLDYVHNFSIVISNL